VSTHPDMIAAFAANDAFRKTAASRAFRWSRPLKACIVAPQHPFTEEELDFITNYDIKYRLGRDVEAGD
jgi:hypothetical protein